MEIKKNIKVFITASFCLLIANSSLAEMLQIDIKGRVVNTYISDGANDSAQVDAVEWGLNDLIPLESVLKVKFSYDTSVPSFGGGIGDGYSMSWYNVSGITVASSKFQAETSTETVIGMTVIDSQQEGIDDWINVSFLSSGIKVNYGSEDYYLMSGSIDFNDESGKSLTSSALPTNQSTINSFWLNRPADPYWVHLASYNLVFVKDPILNAWENSPSVGHWPISQAFYVIGAFDGATLSKVPEPSSYLLMVLGVIAVGIRRLVN